jgi:hypothetical protein
LIQGNLLIKSGKLSGSPEPLGKEWGHCSFCATALREIRSPIGLSANFPFSLSVEQGTPSSAPGLIAIVMRQPILVQRPRENWGLPCIPSCFSALLKYALQKINCAIAAWHFLVFV